MIKYGKFSMAIGKKGMFNFKSREFNISIN